MGEFWVGLPKCGTFSIIQALMRVLLRPQFLKQMTQEIV